LFHNLADLSIVVDDAFGQGTVAFSDGDIGVNRLRNTVSHHTKIAPTQIKAFKLKLPEQASGVDD
jgi:hypothetical protein